MPDSSPSLITLVKAICIATQGITLALSLSPPAAQKTVSSDTDKILEDAVGVKMTKMSIYVWGFHTLLYLALMAKGPSTSTVPTTASRKVLLDGALQQLRVLKPWHVGATVMAVAGWSLRRWSFATLDKFFTFQLTIRPDHQLIGTGPYRYLRHPSYTGALMNCIPFYFSIFHQGLWAVLTAFVSSPGVYSTAGGATAAVAAVYRNNHRKGGMMVAGFLVYQMVKVMQGRILKEEGMLLEHFGREWEEFSKKRFGFLVVD